jgi:hypothetical protein
MIEMFRFPDHKHGEFGRLAGTSLENVTAIENSRNRQPSLELMFRQVDSLLEGDARERVKAFIRFILDEERRRLRREKEDQVIYSQ